MYDLISLRFNKAYSKIEQLVEDEDEYTLTVAEFLTIGIFTQINIAYILHYYNYMFYHNPGVLFIVYIFLIYFIAVPFNMFLLFLGSYTRSKVIRIWNCIPLFKGLGYTIMIARNILLIINQYYTTYLLYMIIYAIKYMKYFDLKDSAAWKNCNFDGATDDCLPVNNWTHCRRDTVYEFSTIQFFRVSIIKQFSTEDFDGIGNIDINLMVINIVLWVVSIPITFMGVKRFVRFYMIIVNMCILPLLVVLIALVINAPALKESSLKYMKQHDTLKSYGGLDSLGFWTMTIIYASGSIESGNIVWLGALMPKKLKPSVASVAIFFFKVVGLFLFTLLLKFTMDLFVTNYRAVRECNIAITGHDIMFDIVIDILLNFDQAFIWLFMYVASLLVYTFMDNIMVGIVVLDSFTDEFSNVKKHRMFLCISQCVVNSLLSLFLMTPIGSSLINVWNEYECTIIGVLLFFIISMLLNYVYSKEMLITDYVFTYNEMPASTLMNCWSACPVIALFLMSAAFFWLLFGDKSNFASTSKIACLIATFIIFLPTFAVFLCALFAAIGNEKEHPDQPVSSWGPHDPETKDLRDHYVPHRNLCYRHSSVTCKHRCLIKVKEFDDEVRTQKIKYISAMNKFVDDDDEPTRNNTELLNKSSTSIIKYVGATDSSHVQF